MTDARRRFDMKWYHITLALILVLVFSPFVLVLAATALADANGCQLDQGSLGNCSIGGALYTMGRLGGLMRPAVPIGLLALAIWLVVLIVNNVIWSRCREDA